MNTNEITKYHDPNLLKSFLENVKGYLKAENKKYPILFTFRKKVSLKNIPEVKKNRILVSCWYERNKIYFIDNTKRNEKFLLVTLPFEKCIQFEVHEDYSEVLPVLNIFPTFEVFSFSLSKILNHEKKKIQIEFSVPVYLPEFSLEPLTIFSIYGVINHVLEENGKTWSNRICLFADIDSTLFYDPKIIPFESCTNVKLIQ